MKTLDRYLLFRMGGALIRALVALSLVYVLIDLLSHRMVDIRRFDVAAPVVAQYYLNFLPDVIQRIAPFALLVSALLVLGDAAQHNEITAVTAGGISLRRFVRMPIVLAALLAAALFGMNETFGATAAMEAERIERAYFATTDPTERKGISWTNLSGNWTCHIGKFNRIALTGQEVLMYSREPDKVQQVEAHRIYWDESRKQWILEDGRWYWSDPAWTAVSGKKIRQEPAPFTESPEALFALENPASTKTSQELKQDIASAEQRNVPAARLHVDYYAKFSQPILSFVIVWLAIPFAIRLRRGGMAIGFATSVIVAITYMLLYSIFVGLGYAERLSPPVAAWSANAIFFVIGLVLFWRTPT
ncbi:MAG: LptF/LptG family permease [Candidatus Hydrogenedentes bacterium]|nr:LptF/LptG family permease [Candidatus Hydrogenedentota bacterium]